MRNPKSSGEVHGAEGSIRGPASTGLWNCIAVVGARSACWYEHDGVRRQNVFGQPSGYDLTLQQTLIPLLFGGVDSSLPTTIRNWLQE